MRYKGGTSVGDTEESTGNELRQAQPIVALLLREGNHAKGKRNLRRQIIDNKKVQKDLLLYVHPSLNGLFLTYKYDENKVTF